MFKRNVTESGPVMQPFSRYKVEVTLADGARMLFNGYVDSHHAEQRRAVEAMARGLRDAGFGVEVAFVQEVVTRA